MKNKAQHKARREAYEKYARDVADRMGLRDWEVRVSEHRPEKGIAARLHATEGRKYAWIAFGKCFYKLSPEKQRQTVVHELVHIHFTPMHLPLFDGMESELARKFYVSAFEYGVDAIADIIAPSMPLPPKREKPTRRRAKNSN